MELKNIEKKTKVNKWIAILGVSIFVVLVVLLVALFSREKIANTPTITIETPPKMSLSNEESFTLDVTISDLGEAIYPAASMSISFDSSRMELLNVKEGNVFVLDSANSSHQKLPEWSYNVAEANKSGLINVMYLDMTGGKNAFQKDLLAKDDNVVLRLEFRLRGSVRAGDVYDLLLEDAVFAASDEKQSLAMANGTLKTRNSKVVIGE